MDLATRAELGLLVLVFLVGGLYLAYTSSPVILSSGQGQPVKSSVFELYAASVEKCLRLPAQSWAQGLAREASSKGSEGLAFYAVLRLMGFNERENKTYYESIVAVIGQPVYRIVFSVNAVGLAEYRPVGVREEGGVRVFLYKPVEEEIGVPGIVTGSPLCPATPPRVFSFVFETTNGVYQLTIPARLVQGRTCVWLEGVWTGEANVTVLGAPGERGLRVLVTGLLPRGEANKTMVPVTITLCDRGGRISSYSITGLKPPASRMVEIDWAPVPLKPGFDTLLVNIDGLDPVILPLDPCALSS